MIRDALRDAIRTDRMGRDEKFAKYVNDTLGMKFMPTMSKERSVDNEVSNFRNHGTTECALTAFSAPPTPWDKFFAKRLTNKID